MPKRVSLKGKGADIFFGDSLPSPSPNSASDEPAQAATSSPPPTAATPRTSDGHQAEASTRTSARARTHARAGADTSARVRTAMKEELHRKLRAKQRLASYTLRFRPDELEELEQVLAEIGPATIQKPSKNDLVRLGLMWLLADYRENGDESVLVQVLARS